MNSKIKNYIEVLFSDIPKTKKAIELKEEMLSNLSERFDDYVREGKSETQAYSLAVSGMGDVDELLDSVKPDATFVSDAKKYRVRKARNTTIAVTFFVLGVISLIMVAGIGEFMGSFEDFFGIIGLVSMLTLGGIGVAILIYTNMSMPPEYKEYNKDEEEEYSFKNKRTARTFKSIMSVYWSVVLLIYLVMSFALGNWATSWIIWPIAGILSGIIKTLFEIGDADD